MKRITLAALAVVALAAVPVAFATATTTYTGSATQKSFFITNFTTVSAGQITVSATVQNPKPNLEYLVRLLDVTTDTVLCTGQRSILLDGNGPTGCSVVAPAGDYQVRVWPLRGGGTFRFDLTVTAETA